MSSVCVCVLSLLHLCSHSALGTFQNKVRLVLLLRLDDQTERYNVCVVTRAVRTDIL